MSFSAADISRRLENLLCYATVAEVDNAAHLVRPLLGLSVEGIAYVRRAVLEAIKPD